MKAIHSSKTMVAFHPLHSIIPQKTELFKTLNFFITGNVRCLYSTLWCMVSGLWWNHILSLVTVWLKSFHLLHDTSSKGSYRYPNSYAYAAVWVVLEPSLHKLYTRGNSDKWCEIQNQDDLHPILTFVGAKNFHMKQKILINTNIIDTLTTVSYTGDTVA
jgi:hypothetical protein